MSSLIDVTTAVAEDAKNKVFAVFTDAYTMTEGIYNGKYTLSEGIKMLDPRTQESWKEYFVHMTEDTVNKWNGVVLRYDAFLKNRQALGIPAFDNDGTMVQEYSVSSPGWTTEDDAYLRSVHNIIIKIARYLQDVEKGVRAIAWDSLNKDAAVLAVEGEPTIRTGKDPNAPVGYNDKDGDIVVSNFTNEGSKHVLPSDFVAGVGVGEPVTITGIVVGGLVVIGLTIGTVLVINKVCDLLDDHLTRAEAADIRRQQDKVIDTCDTKCPPNDLQCYDDCLNKAKGLTEATTAAIKTNEEARAAANKASDTQALYDTIKTVSLVALGLGVVGGVGYGIYRFAGPRPKRISEGRYPALGRGRPMVDAEVVSSRAVSEPGPRSIKLGYDVYNVFQQYWWGQSDPLYAVLSRRGHSVDIVTVDVSEDELIRLNETAEEILADKNSSKSHRRVAKAFLSRN